MKKSTGIKKKSAGKRIKKVVADVSAIKKKKSVILKDFIIVTTKHFIPKDLFKVLKDETAEVLDAVLWFNTETKTYRYHLVANFDPASDISEYRLSFSSDGDHVTCDATKPADGSHSTYDDDVFTGETFPDTYRTFVFNIWHSSGSHVIASLTHKGAVDE
jgi:hypothetical protein